MPTKRPSLVDHLTSHLAASVPGQHRYAVHVLRSEPQRSRALFPHATNAATTKVWHEETLVVLSERRPVPHAPSVDPNGTASPPAQNGDRVTADGPPPAASTAALPRTAPAAAPEEVAPPREALIPVAAIEASLYYVPTSSCALLYISKVDTTGLASSSSRVSPTRALVSAFLAHHLAYPPHGARRLRVHVFARAQSQYLFPGSADNVETKRVLDDKQLIRWWKATLESGCQQALQLLDPTPEAAAAAATTHRFHKFYLVPGISYLESLPYVPVAASTASAGGEWTYGHPYGVLSSPLHPASDPHGSHPLPDHLPAFPDDPKARFLHSLTSSPVAPSGTAGDYDDAYRALGSATFSAGTTPAQKAAELERQVERERARLVQGVPGGVDEWWERMAFRQECCAGQLVAFLVVAVGEITAAGSYVSSTATSGPTADSRSASPGVVAPAAPAPAAPTPTHAPAPRRPLLALRPAQYTKHWSTLHNFDYSLPALGRLAEAAERWYEGVAKAYRSTAVDEGEIAPSAVAVVTGAEVEGGTEETNPTADAAANAEKEKEKEDATEREWRMRYEREVAREVVIDNPLPVRAAGAATEGSAGEAQGPAGDKRSAPVVNVLAPRKKKKKVEA